MLFSLFLSACAPEEPVPFSTQAAAATGYAAALCLPPNTGPSNEEFSGRAVITIYGIQQVFTYEESLEFSYAGTDAFALHCAMLNNKRLGSGVMAFYNIVLNPPLKVDRLMLVYWGAITEVESDGRFRSVHHGNGMEESKTRLWSYEQNRFQFNLFAAQTDIVTVTISPIPEGEHLSAR